MLCISLPSLPFLAGPSQAEPGPTLATRHSRLLHAGAGIGRQHIGSAPTIAGAIDSLTPTDTSADRIGQAAEWLVWAQLTVGSTLHVFLPLRDMGIDAVVHVPGTDVGVAIQVKSRHVLEDGKLHLLVRDHELRDPRAVIVAVVYDRASRALHDTAICVDVPTFRRLAFARHGRDHGYQASIPYPPPPGSRWHPYATPLDGLAERVCPAPAAAVAPPLLSVRLPAEHGSDVGYRAEARLLALLAEDARLNSFKAFPDLEMAEYLVRHVDTGALLAVQVKAISVDADHPRGTVKVPSGTFRPTPSTYVTVFAEHRDDGTPHALCLLIPSKALGDLLDEHADGELTLTWDPDSPRHDAGVAPYRCPTAELPGRIAVLLERDTDTRRTSVPSP